MEFFPLKHVAIFKPFKEVLEKYQPIRRGGTCIAGKTKSIPMSFYPVLSPLSNDINVTPHLLVFTRNVKVEDMLSKKKYCSPRKLLKSNVNPVKAGVVK